jgi:hypothetical protein
MMKIAKKTLDFFLSLRTGLWLLLLLLCILLYGSFIMPFKEEFQALHVMPLFRWMTKNPLDVVWWLWASVGVLSLLTANTLFCSIESVVKKRGAKNLLLVLSPQVIHIGFLFVLLAHLLSSYGSSRETGFVADGTVVALEDGTSVFFEEIKAEVDSWGYISDWSAGVSYLRDGARFKNDVIRPNSPSFHDGFGIYIKTVRFQPYPVALIEISRDPGAIWALVGGILFLAGMTTLLALKIKREH